MLRSQVPGDRLVLWAVGYNSHPAQWPLYVAALGRKGPWAGDLLANRKALRMKQLEGFGHRLIELFAELEYFKRSRKVQTAFSSSIYTENNGRRGEFSDKTQGQPHQYGSIRTSEKGVTRGSQNHVGNAGFIIP